MKELNFEAVGLKESVFSTITQLSERHQAINLAQGFPDFDAPAWLLDEGSRSFFHGKNQYAPSYGAPALRQAISVNYRDRYGLDYDPTKEILITNGATEAIYCTVRALVNPGDEVIAFEPLYDSYAAAVHLARGVLKPVTLHAPDFSFDRRHFESRITPKTKLLILNNPHNPTGRVFTTEELSFIAGLACRHNFYILSDEVYEYLSFEHGFLPTAKLEGLHDRVITVSSIGKSLSLTGWKIGWVCAPAILTDVIHNVHQFVSFCVAHPLQIAIAKIFEKLPDYLVDFRRDFTHRKELMTQGLDRCGIRLLPSAGTYFVVARVPAGFSDWSFSRQLIVEKKVATMPLSPFYLESREGEDLIRFCFAKKESTIREALANLDGGK